MLPRLPYHRIVCPLPYGRGLGPGLGLGFVCGGWCVPCPGRGRRSRRSIWLRPGRGGCVRARRIPWLRGDCLWARRRLGRGGFLRGWNRRSRCRLWSGWPCARLCCAVRGYCRASDDLPGFGNVAIERFWFEIISRAELGQEIIGQGADVFAALAQRGDADGNYAQAIVEIFAEFLLRDQFLQIAIGGGDDAHRNLDGLLAADAMEFAFLQNAEEFGLRSRVEVADFV